MKRRSFIKGSAALAATPLLAGTGLRLAGAQDLSGKLALWHGWTGAEADTLNNTIIPAWKTANPNVEVEALAVPFDQLKNKFSTDTATGGGPDLLIGPADWVGELATGELIKALDDMATSEITDAYLPATIDQLKFDGKLYGLPESFECVALYYNTDLVKTAPKDTNEVYSVSAGMASGTYGLALLSNFYHPAGFLFGFGGQLFDDQNKCILSSPETVNFLTWLGNFTTKPGLFQQNDDAAISSLFKSGKAGMVVNGPWSTADDLKGSAFSNADNLGIATVPAGSVKAGAPVGGHNLVVYAGSKNLDASYLFVAFLNSAQNQATIAAKNNVLPTRTSAYADPQVAGSKLLSAFADPLKAGVGRPPVPGASDLLTPLDSDYQAILGGQKSPQDALNDAATQFAQILPDFKKN